MGQAASRQAVKEVQKVAKSATLPSAAAAAAAPRPPPLGRPVADAPEATEDAIKALRERQVKETQDLLKPQPGAGGPPPQSGPPQMPQPDQNSGFYRGQISDPRDVSQEKFLAHQSGAPQSGAASKPTQAPELAPDLLKFLQDAGPLEKKVNKVSAWYRRPMRFFLSYL